MDDEQGPRESLRMVLAPRHHVHTAASADEALALLRSSPFDLLTVDLRMPGMRGDELARIVRAEWPRLEIIIVTGCGTLESAVTAIRLGVCDYLAKPFDVAQVEGAVERALARRDASPSPRIEADPRAFLERLVDAIDEHDPRRRGHARRVEFLVGSMAERLALPVDARERARLAALVHDVGRLCLPAELSGDPSGLPRDQRQRLQSHAEAGSRLLEPLGLPSDVLDAVRHHHERWDGQGRPDALVGTGIPLAARLLAVADAYDAMTYPGRGDSVLAPDRALEELRKQAGSQFDPALVAELIAVVEGGGAELPSAAREHFDG